nr:hypothetical protein [Tanacetum cinerariifolium]
RGGERCWWERRKMYSSLTGCRGEVYGIDTRGGERCWWERRKMYSSLTGCRGEVYGIDTLGFITTWEDLTTRFLAQLFPPGRTVKVCNDILTFQQHHGESLSEAWTRFNDLLQKTDRAVDGELRNKNAKESWEVIEDLTLYDHEGWNDIKEFVKPVKANSTPQSTSKTLDRRLLELEDQINFLLKGSRPTPRSSTHNPHAYANAVYSNPHPQY